MKNTFGTSVAVTLFGESHGPAIGAVIDGLAPGVEVKREFIEAQLQKRRPYGAISTARVEGDRFQILSGVVDGRTTGTPLCITIPNEDVRSKDYSATRALARPSHADYTAFVKYHGYEDYRGGGHFSGRITAALVAAGAIAQYALSKKGIAIGTHIASCGGVDDRRFAQSKEDLLADINKVNQLVFAALDERAGEEMQQAIMQAASENDSVGGVLETAVCGMPAGVGEPWFDTVEGVLAHMLFSIPAVKGVSFGDGFELASLRGSVANDPFCMSEDAIETRTNRNGGINGGITNGMPLLFRTAIKPTPSIAKPQNTVDFMQMRDAQIELHGRHDPAIVHRARVVVDSVTALTLCDLLAQRFGTDWLGDE